MFRTMILATTSLVLASTTGFAATHQLKHALPAHKIQQGAFETKINAHLTLVSLPRSTQKGIAAPQHLPPPTTFSNFSKEANATFLSWYGWFASAASGCYSYSGYSYCYNEGESLAVPVTGTGAKAKSISIGLTADYASYYGYSADLGVWSDASGIPGSEIAGGQVTAQTTSACCVPTVSSLGKGVKLAAGTPYWVVLSPDAGGTTLVLWDVQDSDYVDPDTLDYNFYESTSGGYSYSSGWESETTQYGPSVKL